MSKKIALKVGQRWIDKDFEQRPQNDAVIVRLNKLRVVSRRPHEVDNGPSTVWGRSDFVRTHKEQRGMISLGPVSSKLKPGQRWIDVDFPAPESDAVIVKIETPYVYTRNTGGKVTTKWAIDQFELRHRHQRKLSPIDRQVIVPVVTPLHQALKKIEELEAALGVSQKNTDELSHAYTRLRRAANKALSREATNELVTELKVLVQTDYLEIYEASQNNARAHGYIDGLQEAKMIAPQYVTGIENKASIREALAKRVEESEQDIAKMPWYKRVPKQDPPAKQTKRKKP